MLEEDFIYVSSEKLWSKMLLFSLNGKMSNYYSKSSPIKGPGSFRVGLA